MPAVDLRTFRYIGPQGRSLKATGVATSPDKSRQVATSCDKFRQVSTSPDQLGRTLSEGPGTVKTLSEGSDTFRRQHLTTITNSCVSGWKHAGSRYNAHKSMKHHMTSHRICVSSARQYHRVTLQGREDHSEQCRATRARHKLSGNCVLR